MISFKIRRLVVLTFLDFIVRGRLKLGKLKSRLQSVDVIDKFKV